MNDDRLSEYSAPTWAADLPYKPTCKLQLSMPNTPIDKWQLPEVYDGKYNVKIKRDDMTGCSLSGNKIRKLEFLLADALKKGITNIITCGGVQSNHCRATAISCAQLGLKCHLFLNSPKQDAIKEGNLFMDVMCGAKIHMVTDCTGSYLADMKHLWSLMQQEAENIRKLSGEESCLFPVGGSDEVGVWGYINAFNEIQQQVENSIDDIIFACGSGGTAAGLAVGNYLAGSPYRIHAVCVCDNSERFYNYIDDLLLKLGLSDLESRNIVTIHDNYVGRGYALSSHEEADFICKVARTTGIFLDTCYSGKAAFGLKHLINTQSELLKGTNILFLHTGGLFGIHTESLRNHLLSTISSDTQ